MGDFFEMRPLPKGFAVAAALSLTFFSGLAAAQSQRSALAPPPIRAAIDRNNVDLIGRYYTDEFKELDVGCSSKAIPCAGSLSFVRTLVENGWRHNWTMQAIGMDTDPLFTVIAGSKSHSFSPSGSGYTNLKGDGSVLTTTSVGYHLVEADGTEIEFTRLNGGNVAIYMPDYASENRSVGTRVIRPNGEVVELKYKTYQKNATSPIFARITSVVSSLGYQLKFEYKTDVWTGAVVDEDWQELIRVTAFNSASDACSPAADHCPGLAASWPSVVYSTTYNRMASPGSSFYEYASDPSGATTRYTWTNQGPRLLAIRRPDSSIDTTVLTYADLGRLSDVIRDGVSTFYYPVCAPAGLTCNSSTTDQLGRSRKLWIEDVGGVSPMVVKDQDELNRAIVLQYDGFGRRTNIQMPEGNSVGYVLDGRGNATSTHYLPKPGQPGSEIVETATFPAVCANIRTCNRPSDSTDANGYTTTFTYSPDHGGVLTRSEPAVAGVASVTRYGYRSRSAWVATTGGYVSNTPVWVVETVRTCLTTATVANACAGGAADESTTTYEYGPASGPNNLLVRGRVVTANGLSVRTCYGYDALGNLVSETQPGGTASICP